MRAGTFLKACLLLALTALPLVALGHAEYGLPKGFVSDFANLLSAEERNLLESKLSAFQESNAHEIAIAIVPRLGSSDTIESLATDLFEEWGIGKKKADNGVLILIAVQDREVRIEVGYGLEGALTDAQSYWIIQNVVLPAFREGNFYAGLDAAASKIIAATTGEVIPTGTPTEGLVGDGLSRILSNVFPFIFFIPIWFASILGRSKSWWAGGVLGGITGIIISVFVGFLYAGLASIILFIPLGLLFDFLVSRAYARGKIVGKIPWWAGGGGRWGGGGGFGGFGGGRSGGGGASGRW